MSHLAATDTGKSVYIQNEENCLVWSNIKEMLTLFCMEL